MSVKARASITLSVVVDVYATYRYYLLQSSTLSAPAKPTANPPGGDWALAEPAYDGESTDSLYTVELTVFSDGSFAYGEVCLSASFEAAKAAYNKAASAESSAQSALDRADVSQQSVGELEHTMRLEYLARSDFGSYAQQVTAQLEANARAITESYQYAELVSTAAAAGVSGTLEQYMTLLNGQIRRGYLTDPDTHETVVGIAISQKLRFTGSTQTVDGEVCYELDAAQTFGLYTSTGWQFWVGGRKIGWFDSADGMLHVTRMVAEQELKLGDDWLVTSAGGFGVRYVG